MQALADLKFTQPTPVQQKVIPLIMKGKSVVGQSQTGSGKTHAFLLPLFSQLDVNNPNVQVVITTPSRELAYQIYNAAKQINQFAKPNGLSIIMWGGRISNNKSTNCNGGVPKS